MLTSKTEQQKARNTRFRENNPDYYSNWYKKNKTKKLQQQKEWRERNPEAVREWRAKNPERNLELNRRKETKYRNDPKNKAKIVARCAVAKAIREGLLVRPEYCLVCLSDCKPEGHHADYSKLLEVTWLCRACHIDIEKERIIP